MKNALIILVLALVFFCFSPMFGAQASREAAPENADFSSYPILTAPLSLDKIAHMQLRPMTLWDWLAEYGKSVEKNGMIMTPSHVLVHNYNRKIQRWMLEYLDVQKNPNEIVLVNTAGEILYLASCANRIVEVEPCPETIVSYVPEAKEPVPAPSLWDRVIDWLKNLAKFLWWLFLALLLLSLILAIPLLWREWRRSRRPYNPPEVDTWRPTTTTTERSSVTQPSKSTTAPAESTMQAPESAKSAVETVATPSEQPTVLTEKNDDSIIITLPTNYKSVRMTQKDGRVTIIVTPAKVEEEKQ